MSVPIVCRQLSKSFGSYCAINTIDLSIDVRGCIGLIGPNGAGKTTLFSLFTGFLKPSSGSVHILGEHPNATTLRGKVGILPQDGNLPKKIPIASLLKHFAKLHGLSNTSARAETERLLEHFNISQFAEKYPETLSFGQRKCVVIAQALIGNPELVLLDEPTSGLDPVIASGVRKKIQELLKDHATVIISSHNLEEISDICEEVIILKQGKLIAYTTISNLIKQDSYLTILLDQELPERVSKHLLAMTEVIEIRTYPSVPKRIAISLHTHNIEQVKLDILYIIQQHGLSVVEFKMGEMFSNKIVELVTRDNT